MLLPAEYLPDLATRDLLDLEATTTAFEGIGASKFYAVPVAHVQREGTDLLAIPYYGAVQGIWYRKDLFEEKGLDAPNTAENILKAAQALHDPDGSLYGIALPTGGAVTLTYHALAHLAQGAGVQVFGEDGTPEFTTPELVSTLQLYADLAALGTPEGTTMAEARELFLDGKLAMIVDSTSLPQALANRSQDVKRDEMARNMGFVAAIGDGQEDGVTYAYTLALAISKGANRDAAQALVDFLLTDAYNVYWIPQGWAPTLKGFALQWRALKGHDWFGYYEVGMPEDLTDGLRKAPGWGVSSEAAALTASRIYSARLLSAAVDKVLSGEMDAEQAAGWLQEEAAQLQP
jgi:multiple sugar transport system substrate-binding protein